MRTKAARAKVVIAAPLLDFYWLWICLSNNTLHYPSISSAPCWGKHGKGFAFPGIKLPQHKCKLGVFRVTDNPNWKAFPFVLLLSIDLCVSGLVFCWLNWEHWTDQWTSLGSESVDPEHLSNYSNHLLVAHLLRCTNTGIDYSRCPQTPCRMLTDHQFWAQDRDKICHQSNKVFQFEFREQEKQQKSRSHTKVWMLGRHILPKICWILGVIFVWNMMFFILLRDHALQTLLPKPSDGGDVAPTPEMLKMSESENPQPYKHLHQVAAKRKKWKILDYERGTAKRWCIPQMPNSNFPNVITPCYQWLNKTRCHSYCSKGAKILGDIFMKEQ